MCHSTFLNFLHVAYADPPFDPISIRLNSVKTPSLFRSHMPGERGLAPPTVGSLVNSQSLDRHQQYIVNSRSFLAPNSLYSGVESSDHAYLPQRMPIPHITRARIRPYHPHFCPLEPWFGFKHCTPLSCSLVNPVTPADAF